MTTQQKRELVRCFAIQFSLVSCYALLQVYLWLAKLTGCVSHVPGMRGIFRPQPFGFSAHYIIAGSCDIAVTYPKDHGGGEEVWC